MTPVVITGLGAISPLGGNVAETWASTLAGVSGIQRLPEAMTTAYDLPVAIAGVSVVEPSAVLSKPELNRLDRATQFALIAAREAWADAGFGDIAPERLAVSVSSALGGITTTLGAWDAMTGHASPSAIAPDGSQDASRIKAAAHRASGVRRVLPATIAMLMPNAAAAVLSVEFNAQAGAHAPTSACAAGAEAIAYGYQLIQSGAADVVIAGGCEAPVHPMVIASFAAARALSKRNDSPETASRPFALDRDGFVLAEGAGIAILESEAHARARNARYYARLAGTGITADAHHLTAPEPTGRGQIGAMVAALRQADALPSDVGHINPHATSTPLGDGVEASAISSVLGGAVDGAVVSATKSMTGHLLGGAGGLEAVLTVLAVANRVAPPTINTSVDPDPAIGLHLQYDQPGPLPSGRPLALSNSFGFGGHNVCLAFAP